MTEKLVSIFLPDLNIGGSEKVAITLAREFIQYGLRVDFVLVKAKGDLLQEVPTGANVVDLKASNFVTSLPALVRYLKVSRPQTLLSFMDFSNVFAVLARILARVQTRIVIRIPTTLSLNITPWYKKVMGRILFHFTYPLADQIVSVSDGAAADLVEFAWISESLIKTIYNPIITADLFLKAAEPADDPWFRPEEPPVIIAVGRLDPAKDYPTLLQAFARANQTLPMRLIILGEGKERSRLEDQADQLGISESIRMPGFSSNPFAYLSKAQAYVMSSAWEGLPGTLIQAMACGCPVISTNCKSGPAEILNNGEFGHLVSVGDPEELADAILDVLAENGRQVPVSWLEQFTAAKTINQYIEVVIPEP